MAVHDAGGVLNVSKSKKYRWEYRLILEKQKKKTLPQMKQKEMAKEGC